MDEIEPVVENEDVAVLAEPVASPQELPTDDTTSIPVQTDFTLPEEMDPVAAASILKSNEYTPKRQMQELEDMPKQKRKRNALGRSKVDWQTVIVTAIACAAVVIIGMIITDLVIHVQDVMYR